MKKTLLIAFFCLLLVGCQSNPQEAANNKEIPVYEQTADYNAAGDFSEMIKKSINIVEGKFVAEIGADKLIKYYKFQVDNVYKGKISEKEIYIGQFYKSEVTDLPNEEGKGINLIVNSGSFIKPNIGKKSILFLGDKSQTLDGKTKSPNGIEVYSLIVHPWYIEFDQNDKAIIKTPPSNQEEIVVASDQKTKVKVVSEGYDFKTNHVNGRTYSEIVKELKEKQKTEPVATHKPDEPLD